MLNVNKIIDEFYPDQDPLRPLFLKHSSQVRDKALAILKDSGLDLDPDAAAAGAMLHDIGIVRCHAPSILCMGSEPYIAHGIIGGIMLRQYGAAHGLELETFARICERHTGSGLTASEIRRQGLPLPERDFLPETPLEKLICLADKFYSKSGDMEEKSMDRILRGMAKFDEDSVTRFLDMCRFFHVPLPK